jgi:hypothetical protein
MHELAVNVPSVSARLLEKATVELQKRSARIPRIVARDCVKHISSMSELTQANLYAARAATSPN